MTERLLPPINLPMLSLPEIVVLPGMVVPVELDDAAQAVVDAARAGSDGQLLIAPRLADRYPVYGAIAEIEQVGRLPGGEPAAVLRASARAKIGSGVSGPGAALWIEAAPVDDPEPTAEARELAAEYKRLVIAVLQRRNAWQVVDSVQRVNDPSELADLAGYASYLSAEQKRELLETPDVEDRKSTRLNSSHRTISYAVFCLKKKNTNIVDNIQTKNKMKRLKLYRD